MFRGKDHGIIRVDWHHASADEQAPVDGVGAKGHRHDGGNRHPPILPDRVWEATGVRDALNSRHFGRLLLAYRKVAVPGLKQTELARWLGITQGQLSRMERANTSPRDLAKLEQWAKALYVPRHLLWFDLSDHDGRAHTVESGTAHRRSGAGGYGMVAIFLRWQNPVPVVCRLSGPVADDDLRRKTAETYQRAAWAAYNGGHAALGDRQLRMALRLGEDADDDALVAEVLASLTDHTLFYGQPQLAISLAEAATRSAQRAGLALLRVDTLAMWAQGLALHGASGDSRAVLHRAAKMAVEVETIPANSYLLGTVAFSFRALGHSAEAEWFARRAVEATRGQDLGTLFWNAMLSSALLDLGRVEEASAAGTRAARAESTVFPARAAARLTELAREFGPYRGQPAVRDFYLELARIGIPTPQS